MMALRMFIVLAAVFDFQAAQFWIDVGSVVLTIILAIPTIWPKRRKKLLSYRILSDAALIDERKDLGEDDIQVKIDGNDVTNVRLIMMQIMNIGPQPIKCKFWNKMIYRHISSPLRHAICQKRKCGTICVKEARDSASERSE